MEVAEGAVIDYFCRSVIVVGQGRTVILIGVSMQTLARVCREQDEQQQMCIESPYEFAPIHFRCKNRKKKGHHKGNPLKYRDMMMSIGIRY